MLDVFRRHSGGFVAKFILVLLIISFAAWGVGDMLRSSGKNIEAARVGKTSFSTQDVLQAMQVEIQQLRQKLGKNYNAGFVKQLGIPQQAVGRIIGFEMMEYEVNDLGLYISDDIVANMVKHNSLFFSKEQKFDKEVFQATLKQYNLTEEQYIKNVKGEMAGRLLKQAVTASGSVPDIATKVMMAAAKEKRNIELYKVKVSDIKVEEPTDVELNEYYQSVSSRYTIPEYRTASYVVIDATNVDEVTLTDEEIEQLYNERKELMAVPETRSFKQLLYSNEEDAKKAEKLLKQGKTIKQVAKTLPPVNKDNLDIEDVSVESLPEPLRKQASKMQKGSVSIATKTNFGFHVLQLTDIKGGKTRTLAEARPEIENELRPQKLSAALTKRSNELEDLLAGGSSLAEAAKEMGLTVNTFGPFDNMAKSPEGERLTLPPLNGFAALAFSTEEGADSNVASGKPGVFYLLHVDKVQPEVLPDISTVKKDIIKSWKESRRDTLEQGKAEELAAKLADKESRKQAIKSADAIRLGAGKISREDTKLAGKDLSAILVQDVFSREVDDATNAAKLADGSYAIAIIKSSEMPALIANDKVAESEEATHMAASIKTNMQEELMSQYMDYIADKFGVVIHDDVVSAIEVE